MCLFLLRGQCWVRRRVLGADVWLLPLQTYRLPYRLAARYPRTRIGRLATSCDHGQQMALCDDYVVQNHEFFFDRDRSVFHVVFNFYR